MPLAASTVCATITVDRFMQMNRETAMTKQSVFLATSCLCAALVAAPLQADTVGEGSIRVVGQVAPFLSGSAGSGSGAPDYDDAFSQSIGGALEYHYRLSERFSLLGGVGYDSASGDTYDGIDFSDRDRTSVYAGSKYHFDAAQAGWHPYARVDLGAARLDSVDVSFNNLSAKYWDSSWVFLGRVGAGFEHRMDAWSLYAELLFEYVDRPDEVLGDFARGDGAWSMPLRVGVGYTF
jgi:hypothetical protein